MILGSAAAGEHYYGGQRDECERGRRARYGERADPGGATVGGDSQETRLGGPIWTNGWTSPTTRPIVQSGFCTIAANPTAAAQRRYSALTPVAWNAACIEGSHIRASAVTGQGGPVWRGSPCVAAVARRSGWHPRTTR